MKFLFSSIVMCKQFIATLEELLAELQASPMVPEKQILDEYVHSVSFLKGLIVTEKLV